MTQIIKFEVCKMAAEGYDANLTACLAIPDPIKRKATLQGTLEILERDQEYHRDNPNCPEPAHHLVFVPANLPTLRFANED
ncbi:hypothetical protein KKE45_00270 [Patescibacteria group bacterium]|nr:hypothetical protein [Patescibacteria group bacterium]